MSAGLFSDDSKIEDVQDLDIFKRESEEEKMDEPTDEPEVDI